MEEEGLKEADAGERSLIGVARNVVALGAGDMVTVAAAVMMEVVAEAEAAARKEV